MFKYLTTAAAVGAALASAAVVAAPSTPSINWKPQNYSFVDVNIYGRGSYKQLIQAKDVVDIQIEWNAWSGKGGNSYKVYFDNEVVNEGTLAEGTTGGTIRFPYHKSGRHELRIALCDASGCSMSASKPIVIADTDGGHLEPLKLNVNPNNKKFDTDPNTVVGAYFVEWGIYGRKFDVTQIPADNLTHLLYGFIPVCGPNDSLAEIENGNSLRALKLACGSSKDYEVVIHDPWAAVQKALPGISSKDPIRGTYAQLMALKQRNPDLKILPSVGGWTLSDPFFDFDVKANRDTFVNSMREFLKTWKFYDGIDIDWEFPGGDGANPDLGSDKDGEVYIILMKELREMLDELEIEMGREFELTSAIGTGYDKIEDVDYQQAAQYMDYIFAMTYDFAGGWNNVTGHQTAIYCGSHMSTDECNGTGVDDKGEARKGPAYTLDNAIKLLLAQGVPSEKLVVGTAMYGRGWEGVYPQNAQIADNPMTAPANGKLRGSTSQGVWEAGVIDYKGLKAHMIGHDEQGINGFEVGYDEQAEAAYVWNRQKGTLVTYDSPRSVRAKGRYVREHNLAGLFAWEIDADNGDILNAMHEGLAGKVTNPTPVNKAPVVTLTSQITLNAGDIDVLTAQAIDPEGKALTFSWQGDAALNLQSENDSVIVTAPSVTSDSVFTVNLAVSDGANTVNRTVKVIVKAPVVENKAPVVGNISAISLDENTSKSISVSATDPEGKVLSFAWQLPGHTIVGTGSTVTVKAGEVTQTETLTGTVVVSDGEHSVTRQFNVTIKNVETDPEPTPDDGKTTWDANKVYTGGNTVWYKGVQYKARWWTRGAVPSNGGVWAEIIPDDGKVRDWRSDLVYTGGDKVVHNGETYQARWWTRGQTPGSNSVWRKL
ncbi:chitinase [Pseudoalteromonas luteoviolacea CPMOR-1]|uniref:chitinase n=1 Tax=Pseudoalteromonas luteoviolacea CPMOR-1 TaxID=1365248 RepID=A0A167KH66_9GAMM|nr:glycosyl hydrolase family 18 protein [Pseudoalteromonas luteoviolacea]KZN62790.1 chitinase [Pseudoalteromonas luteoviolacea CPMOR-1]